ncbi:hypothetical protein [Roseibium sp. Sym1]|uniref:hypothetical protein n=1 Tax=Roseibium sp. Sym1 TaxID=3016006 RepID=UPI0022B32F6F|nr:hypothetical protein [Roseibium sp. Sym1]
MQAILKQTHEGKSDRRRKGHLVLKLVAGLVCAAVALTWFWTTTAVEVFEAPALRFSDAFATVLVLMLLAFGCGTAFRLGRDRDDA